MASKVCKYVNQRRYDNKLLTFFNYPGTRGLYFFEI